MTAAKRAADEVIGKNYIRVDHLNKFFEKDGKRFQVLDDITFRIGRGDIVCIVGSSGCGKSTLLRAINGLDADHEGSVIIDGKEIVRPEKERGMVFQEHRLFPWLTVSQNVGYAYNGKDKQLKKELVQKYIDLVGLSGFEKAYPRQLSGGMAQRAGIARALLNNPDVLLLDEPFGALDALTKITMQKELKRIQKSSNTTMIMVTHDIDEAVYLSDKILVLSSRPGRLQKEISVNLPVPRNRNSYEFMEIRKQVYEEFMVDEFVEEDFNI